MLSAVAILIERTKTHPEEFANGHTGDFGKWDDVIKEFNLCMTTEEREALESALTNARREMFNEAVMKRLAGSDKKNDLLEEIAIRSNKPKSILTMSQITEDSLKILEQQLTMKGIKYATEYDVATDSYTLAQQVKK
jgi:hypothetical protein